MASFENLFKKNGFKHIAGVDEVGRGPLAGPVVACAVIYPSDSGVFDLPPSDIKDSKALTPKAREKKYWEILSVACIGIGIVSEREIDTINILQASLLAMRKAIWALSRTPEVVLIDGNHQIGGRYPFEQVPIVGGDKKSITIAAASIVAKVVRDRLMEEYHEKFPEYGFNQHKGYPTPIHLSALKRHGPSPIHRKSFDPVARCLLNV